MPSFGRRTEGRVRAPRGAGRCGGVGAAGVSATLKSGATYTKFTPNDPAFARLMASFVKRRVGTSAPRPPRLILMKRGTF